MNIIMSYQCPMCKRVYNDPDTATKCELGHRRVQQTQPVYVPMQPYPELIQVQMSDGSQAVYVLHRGGAPCGR